jgi:hypothetical protein
MNLKLGCHIILNLALVFGGGGAREPSAGPEYLGLSDPHVALREDVECVPRGAFSHYVLTKLRKRVHYVSHVLIFVQAKGELHVSQGKYSMICWWVGTGGGALPHRITPHYSTLTSQISFFLPLLPPSLSFPCFPYQIIIIIFLLCICH